MTIIKGRKHTKQLDPKPVELEHRTKEEQVADFLREGILAGRYARGSRLKQLDLAKQLGISITPVREALKILEAEGYVVGGLYRGAMVAEVDLAASTEILNLRTMLESLLVQSAVEKAKSSDFQALRLLADEFAQAVKAGDRSAARGSNYRFHRRLYDIAEMPQTLHFVQVLWARYPFDLINGMTGRGSVAADEHEEMLEFIIARDASGATLALRRHIETGWEAFKAALSANQASKNAEIAAK